ncbi:hypothetical protein [Rhodopseudomonas palustris]|uniref:hypothetical protein n=1 Tax=Rhodopseudomonas palustris TaxID=1076 RepID=UPI001603177A|nr:hypothetical protein [Rhodopseudomonas palustris]
MRDADADQRFSSRDDAIAFTLSTHPRMLRECCNQYRVARLSVFAAPFWLR